MTQYSAGTGEIFFPAILVDDEDRENEGDLTMATSMVTPEADADMHLI